MSAREIAEVLRDKLAPHTFRAVMSRAVRLDEGERREMLAEILAERERAA